MSTDKIKLYWVAPTFDREPIRYEKSLVRKVVQVMSYFV